VKNPSAKQWTRQLWTRLDPWNTSINDDPFFGERGAIIALEQLPVDPRYSSHIDEAIFLPYAMQELQMV
jgi:hypothetical protein